MSDLKHWKIKIGEMGYLTQIEVDGVVLQNVVALKINVDGPSANPTITLTIDPWSVEVEGDLAGAQIVAQGRAKPTLAGGRGKAGKVREGPPRPLAP